jgi:singapore isolate B (sub-type 7) whole genome shotgun sequence assembly, scaffold_31 (fragment)
VRLIDEDLARTFALLGSFSRGEPMYGTMRSMLLAYAYYRPDVGYVQGMSFLAGMLALHIPDPAVCFQCLANLLGGEHLYAFYSLKVGLLRGDQADELRAEVLRGV